MKDHAAKMELNSMHNKLDGNKRKLAQYTLNTNKKQILSNYDILRGVELVQFDKRNDYRNRHTLEGGVVDQPLHFDFMDVNLVNKKSSRACKGKRYKEFMTTGKMNQTRQRSKVKSIDTIGGGSSAGNRGGKYDYASANTIDNDLNLIFNRNVGDRIDGDHPSGCQHAVTDTSNGAKLFDASDFDLEDKIKALPSLSLDKYLSRKRESKKQKKMTGKLKVFVLFYYFSPKMVEYYR